MLVDTCILSRFSAALFETDHSLASALLNREKAGEREREREREDGERGWSDSHGKRPRTADASDA